ncbi:unnamed protein product [Calypogeia fissa]
MPGRGRWEATKSGSSFGYHGSYSSSRYNRTVATLVASYSSLRRCTVGYGSIEQIGEREKKRRGVLGPRGRGLLWTRASSSTAALQQGGHGGVVYDCGERGTSC